MAEILKSASQSEYKYNFQSLGRLYAKDADAARNSFDSPAQAKEMISIAYELSEIFEIPVMLCPTTRACHSRQDIQAKNFGSFQRKADFKKEISDEIIGTYIIMHKRLASQQFKKGRFIR